MRPRIVVRVAVIAGLGLFVTWTLGSAQVPATPDSALAAEFRALETALADAIAAGDHRRLDEFLAPDYRLTLAVAGAPLVHVGRAEWLNNIPKTRVQRNEFRELSVRREGSTVVVVAYVTLEGTVAGRRRSGDFLLTDVWIEQDDRWRLAWRLSSRPEAREGP
jgi:ketosteroid isomerase-like protein